MTADRPFLNIDIPDPFAAKDSWLGQQMASDVQRIASVRGRMQEDALTAEVIKVLREKGYTVTPPGEPSRDIRCPFCGDAVEVNTHDIGRAYMPDVVPESIACQEYACGAAWEPDGTLRDLPINHQEVPRG